MPKDINELLIEAQRRFDSMSPEDKRKMREDQRRSWVVGNFLLSHPELNREYADEIYDKVVLGIGL